MNKTYKTNKNHFTLFKQEVEYWLNFFGVTAWEIVIVHENVDKFESETNQFQCQAWTVGDLSGKIATIGLSVDWAHHKPTDDADKIDYNFLHKNTLFVYRIIKELDKE